MNSDILVLQDVNTHYGSAHVLHGVTLNVAAGACTAVIGKNGVGKTTLARTIIGFSPPSNGRVMFHGNNIAGWPSRKIARAGIAMVPQGRRVFPSLTVAENLQVAGGRPRKGKRQLWDIHKVYDMFPRLQDRRSQQSGTLSGGEQQMLAIGRALMGNPDLLILDEPTEGLAPIIVDGLIETLTSLKSTDVSLLLLEQRVEVALRLADTAVGMTSRGEIVFVGPPDEYAKQYAATGTRDGQTSNASPHP